MNANGRGPEVGVSEVALAPSPPGAPGAPATRPTKGEKQVRRLTEQTQGVIPASAESSKKRGFFCVFSFSFSFLATEPFISEKVNAQLDGFSVFHVELFRAV